MLRGLSAYFSHSIMWGITPLLSKQAVISKLVNFFNSLSTWIFLGTSPFLVMYEENTFGSTSKGSENKQKWSQYNVIWFHHVFLTYLVCAFLWHRLMWSYFYKRKNKVHVYKIINAVSMLRNLATNLFDPDFCSSIVVIVWICCTWFLDFKMFFSRLAEQK